MIVVAGEALVDLVPDRSGGLRVHYGGGPFNTARWLARLGQPVSFLGTISDDAFGQRLRSALVQDGVGLELVDRTALPTTLALAQLDDSGSATYRFYTEQTAAPALTAEHALSMLPDRLDVLHVGSLGLVLDPIADAVLHVVAAATERAALVMFDPNIRASLIADRDLYLDRFWRALRLTDVLKVSVEDLRWLIPDLPPRDAARNLGDAGPGVVIVTDGPRGAIIVGVTATEDLLVASPAAEVVDTIGAGDAFNAGFLAHWRHYGARLDDRGAVSAATRFACRVAALACAQPGAEPRDVPNLE
jgi:fructokinase